MPDTAHKWKIKIQIQIGVNASRLWNLISTSCYLKKVHPFLSENQCDAWEGIGSSDLMVYDSGFKLQRTITAWYEGEGFDLQAEPVSEGIRGGKASVFVQWRIKTIDEESCQLIICVYPSRLGNMNVAKAFFAYWLKVRPMYKSYFAAVLLGIKQYLETGEIVRTDQFGAHPFFSG